MTKSQRILITGGCGGVGHRITSALAGQGYDIRVFDVVEGTVPGVDYQIGDICDYDAVNTATSGVDHVIHLAAIPIENGDARGIFQVNTVGSFTVIDCAARNGVRSFVFASTVATYGFLHPTVPYTPACFPVDESAPLVPDANYACGKIAVENYLVAYSRGYDMDCIALRLATVMTPNTELWRRVHDNIDNPEHIFVEDYTMADFLWQYVHVEDAVQAFSASIRYANEHRGFGFEAFNIGAQDVASTVPTLELIERYFPGTPVLKNPAEFARAPHATLYGIDKAVRVLGYRPTRSWRDIEE